MSPADVHAARGPWAAWGGAAAVIALLATLIVPFGPLGRGAEQHLWAQVANALHFPLATMVTALLWLVMPRAAAAWRRRLLAGAASTTLLLTLELLQPRFGRSASWVDLRNDLLGVTATLAGSILWSRARAARVAFGVAWLAVFAILLLPALGQARALAWRSRHLPLLAEFEHEIELRLWTPINRPPGTITALALVESPERGDDDGSLRVSAGPRRGGVTYDAGGHDWSGFARLGFEVYNPDLPFELRIRIDDGGECASLECRYDRRVIVGTGWSDVRLPMDEVRRGSGQRDLDLTRMSRVVLFLGPASRRRVFHLDNVRLASPIAKKSG